jgi:uncharacterized membrane protein YeaQ/YmgE (transglycosylase-associated protein family)
MPDNPFTTATSIGVFVRYTTSITGALLALLVLMNWLDQETADALSQAIPQLVGAIGGVVALVIPIYAMVTKSMSNRAAEVAKVTDEEVPPSSTVVVKTPAGIPDITVQPQ